MRFSKSTGLEFTYVVGMSSSFSLSGKVGSMCGAIDNLSATFGQGSTPGLVIAGGSLVSLDLTINSSFQVAGVTFNATDLNFDYVAAGGGSFSMSGTAGVTIGGVNSLTVTIGAGGNPGLVIDDGSLSSLDATINSNFELDGLTFNATGLTFDYLASGGGMFTISGTAGVTIGRVNNLSATFGASGSPGLVINNGSLSSLDMTINSNFEVGGVTIDAKRPQLQLRFDERRQRSRCRGRPGSQSAGSTASPPRSARAGLRGLCSMAAICPAST